MSRTPTARFTVRRLAGLTSAMGCAGCLSIAATGMSFSGVPSAAASTPGVAGVVNPSTGAALTGGGSATPFRFSLPVGSACAGDSANAGYRLQSYLVPASVDLTTLRFDSSGPVPKGGQFRAPMYDTTTTPYVDQLTANAVPAGGPGPVVQPLPSFNFGVYDPTGFPLTAGSYNVGIACTLGASGSPSQLDRYWNATMTIVADAADTGPAKVRFSVGSAAAEPSTTTSTTTSAASSTTAPSGASSSTTSTTSASATTSTTSIGLRLGAASPTSTTTTFAAADVSAASSVATVGELPRTGGSFVPMAWWSFLALCLGRAAVLLGRGPARVIEVR